MKLLAIDGNSILNRAYYGIKLLSTKDGLFTNGIYGFLTILLRMQQETTPEAIAVTFDMRAPTFRHKKYDGYKATRKGMPDELAQQMPFLKDLLKALGYIVIEKEGYEADDLLGTLAQMCTDSGNDCVIATGDRDSFQLIGDRVTVRLASTKKGAPVADIYDTAAIAEKYGVTPSQLIDVKALMGDTSDNIPGVAGVGEKTALSLIQDYQSLNHIYDNLDTLAIRDTLRQKLVASRDMAFLSRELAEIDCHVPVDITPADCLKQPVDNPQAYGLMARLELFSLMERFGVRPEKLRDNLATEPEKEPESESLSIHFNSFPVEILDKTTPLDVLFTFSGGEITAFCAIQGPVFHICDENVADLAQKILSAPCPKRTNQTKALHRYAIAHGFALNNIIFDLEIAAYILNPTANDYDTEKLAMVYAITPLALDNVLGLHQDLVESAAVFVGLADKITALITANGQNDLLTNIELPLALVLADMEDAGFAIDAQGLVAFGDKLDTDIARLQAAIYEYAGEEFNINSPKQLSVILFEKLRLPAGKKTKTGYSTNAEVLEYLADKHPIVSAILEYRKVAKLKSTYVDGLLKVIAPDGRIHTSFQQTLTRTGRISSTEPNMQNIPVRTELGSELRRFFHAEDGKILLDADYSQIELRVLAHIAKDENMIAAFASGEDIHRNTASQVFDMPPAFVTPLMRSRAKAVNFGIVYGIGAFSLANDINVSISEADSYIKSYLQTYSGVRQYMEDIVRTGTEKGYVETLFGRRRYLPELASSNRINREFGKRVAMNTPIQGTAADIIKIAMVRVYNRLKAENLQARLILQVHDELIVESPLAEADQAAQILHEEMEQAVSLTVPMEAEVGTGQTWLDAK